MCRTAELRVSNNGRCLRVPAAAGITAVLNYVDLPVISNTECASIFASYIVSSTLCVSSPGGKSTCSVSEARPHLILFYSAILLRL
jgi:hypothetical protein